MERNTALPDFAHILCCIQTVLLRSQERKDQKWSSLNFNINPFQGERFKTEFELPETFNNPKR